MNILSEVLPGLALTLASSIVLFVFGYASSRRSRPEFLFTFLVFSILTYLVTSLLRDVQLTLGFSFGLLAVFTILRYRSENIPVREMTFLYSSIMLPFINALFLATRISFLDVALINAGVVIFIMVVDRTILARFGSAQTIFYEKIDLIRAGNTQLLLEDLRERTGLPVKRLYRGGDRFSARHGPADGLFRRVADWIRRAA